MYANKQVSPKEKLSFAIRIGVGCGKGLLKNNRLKFDNYKTCNRHKTCFFLTRFYFVEDDLSAHDDYGLTYFSFLYLIFENSN